MPHTTAVLVAVLAVAVLADAAGKNLIKNFSFEAGRSTAPYNLSNPAVSPGWDIQAVLLTSGPYKGSPASGVYADCGPRTGGFGLDFGSEVYPDNVTQVVTTQAGAKYKLSFFLWSQLSPVFVVRDASWAESGPAPTPSNPGNPIYFLPTPHPIGNTKPTKSNPLPSNNQFAVLINGKSVTIKPSQSTYQVPFAMPPYNADFIPAGTKFTTVDFPTIPFSNAEAFPYVNYQYAFTAASSSTKITFQAVNAGSHFTLDDVTMVQL